MDKNKLKISGVIDADIKEILSKLGEELFKLQGKRILITGASGMLARYITLTLIQANRDIFKKPAQLYLVIRNKKEVFGKNRNIHYINADISNSLPKLKNINYIIHAASKAAPKNYTVNMLDTLNSNILGLYNLLALHSKNLESFLYFSSGEIYGNPENSKPIKEEYVGVIDHLNKRSCYIEGKRAGETICMNYFWEKGLPVKIARIFHTFGPGLNIDDGRIFSDFIKNGLEGEDIHIMGDSTIKRTILYIKDATIMFMLLLLSDRNGEVYNISNDSNIVSVREFAKIIRDEFNKYNKKKLKIKFDDKSKREFYKDAVKVQRPDIGKFKQDFKYVPKTSVEEAVSRTVASYLLK